MNRGIGRAFPVAQVRMVFSPILPTKTVLRIERRERLMLREFCKIRALRAYDRTLK